MKFIEILSAAVTVLLLIVCGAILADILLGCTPAPIKPQVTLYEPVLPPIHRSEVQCLSQATWDRFVDRELELRLALLQCTVAVEELIK